MGELVDGAPGTIDTLNELAAALGDDANFATTITNSISEKANIASPTFTGTVSAPIFGGTLIAGTGHTIQMVDDPSNNDDVTNKEYVDTQIINISIDTDNIASGAITNDKLATGIDATKLSGTIDVARIPSLNADKIGAGTLDVARIATDSITNDKLATGIDATKLSGTLDVARIPSLNADKLDAGTLDVARIPGLNANKIDAGTLDVARIAINSIISDKIVSLDASKLSGVLDVARIATGSITSDKIISLDASKLSGTLDVARIATDSITNDKLATGIDATKLSGTLDVARIPSLNADKIDAGTLDVARIPSLNADKINAGTLDVARIPDLNANKINVGTLDVARIPSLNADKINAGTLDVARIPDLNADKINAGTLDVARIATDSITSDKLFKTNDFILFASDVLIQPPNSTDNATLRIDSAGNSNSNLISTIELTESGDYGAFLRYDGQSSANNIFELGMKTRADNNNSSSAFESTLIEIERDCIKTDADRLVKFISNVEIGQADNNPNLRMRGSSHRKIEFLGSDSAYDSNTSHHDFRLIANKESGTNVSFKIGSSKLDNAVLSTLNWINIRPFDQKMLIGSNETGYENILQ